MEVLITTLNKFINYQVLLILLEGVNHENITKQLVHMWYSHVKYERFFKKNKKFAASQKKTGWVTYFQGKIQALNFKITT